MPGMQGRGQAELHTSPASLPERQSLVRSGQRSSSYLQKGHWLLMSDGQVRSTTSPQHRSSSADSDQDASSSLLGKTKSDQLYQIPKYVLAGVISLAAITMVILYLNNITIGDVMASLEHFVNTSGPLGVLAFVAAYAAAAVLFLPGSILTLAAGYLFGLPAGVAIISVAATAGAVLAFLVSRYLARPYIEKQLRSNPKFARIDAGIAAKGARVVLLLRLSPLIPYSLLNYALGLTRVQLAPFALASWVGMIPGTIAYVYLGTLGKEAAKEAQSGIFSPIKLFLYTLGAVATIWVSAIISGIARRALEDPDGNQDQALP